MGKLLGTFFGIGRIPGPTGTYASAVTAALLYAALALGCPLWAVLVAIVISTALGILVSPACIRAFKSQDPHEVVIDEVAGMMIAALPAWCPHMSHWPWATLAIAFFWFRVFDILKPPPIRRLERLPAGWGIMADDLLAGVYALVLTLGNLYLLNHFFG